MLFPGEARSTPTVWKTSNSYPFPPIAVERLHSLVYLPFVDAGQLFALGRFQNTFSRPCAIATPWEWQAVKMPRTRCAQDSRPESENGDRIATQP